LSATIHYGGERWWPARISSSTARGQAFSHDNKEFAAHDGYIFGDGTKILRAAESGN